MAPVAVDSARLTGSFGGPLIAPDSPDYDAARRSFNAFVDRRPALIAQPLDRDDVAAALLFGRSVGLPIAVRGGGHSVAGHGLVDDGLVIDLRRMRSVSVDPVARIARAQGGCQWTDLDTATQAHGLAVPGGTFGDTGIAGLTLGGGIGFLMGIGGYTCDNLIGAELVTADGTIVEVGPVDTPDLLWALRGGGGNFGIVTRLDYRLHEVGPMYGGEFGVRGDDVPAFVARWLAALPDLPDELSPMVFLSANPEVGQIGHVQVAYVGDPVAGDAIVRPIIAPFEPLYDDLGPKTYLQVQAMNGELPFGMRHYWKATFLRELEASGLDAIVTAHASRVGGASGVLIEPIRGAARRFPADHAALGSRDAAVHVSALAIYEDAAEDARQISWARETAAALRPWALDRRYINYLSPDETASDARAAFGPSYDRLRAVKRAVDPDNVFRANINIPPA